MLMTHYNGYTDFTVVDDATGKTLTGVMSVDDQTLEMRVVSVPHRAMFGELVTELVKVSAVRVDYVRKEIHVNEPPAAVSGISVRELHACGECCQEDTCRRIDYCAQWRCGFGEVQKP